VRSRKPPRYSVQETSPEKTLMRNSEEPAMRSPRRACLAYDRRPLVLANLREEIRAAKEALYDIAAHDAEGYEALARRAEEIQPSSRPVPTHRPGVMMIEPSRAGLEASARTCAPAS
jgi:hypothetical protein